MSRIEFRRSKAPKLERRSFLGGAGICLSLPSLEAMLPAGKMAFAQSATPGRMLTFFTGNGCHMQTFTPGSAGDFSKDFRGATTLDPLRNLWQDVTTLKGLHNDPMNGQTGDHGKGSGAFLTCGKVAKDKIASRITMDVVAANEIGKQTRFSNLHIGLEPTRGGFPDNGFSGAYLSNISWLNPSTPVPKETSPKALFNRLFSAGVPTVPGGSNAASVVNRSVIDAVLGDINRLERKLGVADKEKLQGFVNGIRDIENQLDQTDPETTNACVKPTIGSDGNFVVNSRLMNSIMVTAFTCDLTRIISYMFSNGLNNRRYANLGIDGGHHNISHHGGRASNQGELRRIDKYHMEELADLCNKLKAAVDVQGKSLLDSCIVYYSSEIADGDSHSHYNLPVVLVGKGNGVIKSGRHVNLGNTRLANLYVTMMRHVGANVDAFGDSNGSVNLS